MDDKGWIKVNRGIINTDIWKDKEPFDYRSAYLDLMLMAFYKDTTVLTKKNRIVEIKRGQVFTSETDLAKKWGWSRNKIRHYFRVLEGTGEGTIKSTTEGTIITLIKYDVMALNQTANGTAEGTAKGTTEGTTEGTYIKNIRNKRNKENKNNTLVDSVDPAEELFERLWKLYPRKEGKSSVSKEAKKEIYKIGYDRMAKAIDRYARQVAGRDMKYVKMGSSFFNTNYVDYLEEEKPTSAVVPMEQIPRIYPRKYRD